MPPKKIQIITLKKAPKLADDFIPRNMKIVSEAIDKVFSISLSIMKEVSSSSSSSATDLQATATSAYCHEINPSDVYIAAERLALNHGAHQLWDALCTISEKKAEEFVKTVLSMSSSSTSSSTNEDGATSSGSNADDDIAIMKNLSRLWLCWTNAISFIQHLLSWLERAPTTGTSSQNNNKNTTTTTTVTNKYLLRSSYYSGEQQQQRTIRSLCFFIMSDKLLEGQAENNNSNDNDDDDNENNKSANKNNNNNQQQQLIQRAVNGFMICLLKLREGESLPRGTISEMSQLKTVLVECGCYGDEEAEDEALVYSLISKGTTNTSAVDATTSSSTSPSSMMFLPRYLKDTLEYYTKESSIKFGGSGAGVGSGTSTDEASSTGGAVVSCEEFVRHAQARLNEERQRAHLFLTPYSKSFADAAVQKTIISIPYDTIVETGFNTTMNRIGGGNNNNDTSSSSMISPEQVLKRLYFLSGLPNVHVSKRDKLLNVFKLFVSAESTMIISTAQGPQQELQMIPSLLQLYTRCDSIVISRCFSNDETFRMRFREAMEKSLRHRQAKVAEQVARQFDILLREGDRSSAANALLQGSHSSTINNQLTSTSTSGQNETTMNSTTVNSNSNNKSSTSGTTTTTTSASSAETTLAALEKLARFAKLVPAKDIFETFYMRDLAKRLLQFRNINEDLEHTSISRLKVFCGPQVATRCNGMMKDIELSRGFVSNKAEQLREFDPNGTLEPLVLTQGYWPAAPANTSNGPSELYIPLPREFSTLTDNFYRLYCADFKKRKLHWSPVLSSAVIKAKFKKGTKELTVSFIQTHILLMLNSRSSIQEDEIKETLYTHHAQVEKEEAEKKLKNAADSDPATRAMMLGSSSSSTSTRSQLEGLVNDAVDCALISLTAAKILNKQNMDDTSATSGDAATTSKPSSPTIPTDNAAAGVFKKETGANLVYSVNDAFTHRQVKIRIAQVQKRQQEQSTEDAVKSTLAQRSHTVDAAIARIMKARKKIGHWDLVTQTIELTKLPLDPADVKKRIEALIDKDFMKRDADDPSMYLFVA